jgi:hypothetical protein
VIGPHLVDGQLVAAAAREGGPAEQFPGRLGVARVGRSWSWLDGHLKLLAQPGKLPAAGGAWICMVTHVVLPLEVPQQRLQQRPVPV